MDAFSGVYIISRENLIVLVKPNVFSIRNLCLPEELLVISIYYFV